MSKDSGKPTGQNSKISIGQYEMPGEMTSEEVLESVMKNLRGSTIKEKVSCKIQASTMVQGSLHSRGGGTRNGGRIVRKMQLTTRYNTALEDYRQKVSDNHSSREKMNQAKKAARKFASPGSG